VDTNNFLHVNGTNYWPVTLVSFDIFRTYYPRNTVDMADTVNKSDIADFLTNAAWAICSTYHTAIKTSPGAAIFDRDNLLDVPVLADWSQIENTDRNKMITTRTDEA
jgi:hypothetical protein